MCEQTSEGPSRGIGQDRQRAINAAEQRLNFATAGGANSNYNPHAKDVSYLDKVPPGNTVGRSTARSLLNELIAEYEYKAQQLTLLSRSLPLELHPQADEALYGILQRSRTVRY